MKYAPGVGKEHELGQVIPLNIPQYYTAFLIG